MTGLFEGVPLSIVATGMGISMIDFVVRECRAVVDGQMSFARLGTCGLIDGASPVGTVCVASKGALLVRREPDLISDKANASPYRYNNNIKVYYIIHNYVSYICLY